MVGLVCCSPRSCCKCKSKLAPGYHSPVTDPVGGQRCCCCLRGCCWPTGCGLWRAPAGRRPLWSGVQPGSSQSPWSSRGSPALNTEDMQRHGCSSWIFWFSSNMLRISYHIEGIAILSVAMYGALDSMHLPIQLVCERITNGVLLWTKAWKTLGRTETGESPKKET